MRNRYTYLIALDRPRSSGGSFRSLTASITADRRSETFFSGLGDSGDGFEEAHLGLLRDSTRRWKLKRGFLVSILAMETHL